MRFKILLGCLMTGVFSLPAHAVPDTVGKAFVEASVSRGLEAFGLGAESRSLRPYLPVTPSPILSFISWGYCFSPEVNLSFFLGTGNWLHHFSWAGLEPNTSHLYLTVLGAKWDTIIYQFENGRVLAGASVLTSSFVFPEGSIMDPNQYRRNLSITSFTPSLSYEHFFGSNFSLGGSLTLPISFSFISWSDGFQQNNVGVRTHFEPLMFAKYYF